MIDTVRFALLPLRTYAARARTAKTARVARMELTYAEPQEGDPEAEDMQTMWQFLNTSLSTTGGLSSAVGQSNGSGVPVMAAAASEEIHDSSAPNDEDNGMYNELGDVFSMFFNIDSDDNTVTPPQAVGALPPNNNATVGGSRVASGSNSGIGALSAAAAAARSGYATEHATGATDLNTNQKVQLPRSASASSSQNGGSGFDSISPGLLGYPSMSPATVTWLQSLATSTSSESLTGLISPATMYGGPNITPGSAGDGVGSAGVVDTTTGSAALSRCVSRMAMSVTHVGTNSFTVSAVSSPSSEIIDWKAYNDAVGMSEKVQKEPPKWRVIPQHGPHAADSSASTVNTVMGVSSNATGAVYGASASIGYAKPPPSSGPSQFSASSNSTTDGGLRNHFTRQFQTIKSTVVSLVGALSTSEAAEASNAENVNPLEQKQQAAFCGGDALMYSNTTSAPGSSGPPGLSLAAQEQLYQASKRMSADEKNKRKAIISPEYVQYGSNHHTALLGNAALPVGGGAMYMADPARTAVGVKLEASQFATDVADPTGRRPSKKSLHPATSASQDLLKHGILSSSSQEKDDLLPPGSVVRCKCTGKCRNARCACVKAGFVCGVHCKCVSCANPFVPMQNEGINIQTMVQDVCLMQYLSKVKDMQELLDSTVAFDCGHGSAQVKHAIEHGITCTTCEAHFTYSWCNHRLCHDQKKPRKHCAKCRRCGDHRNEHCDECNHCYFAGVANSFSCSCKAGGATKTSGNGVKARAVVPNVARKDDSSNDLTLDGVMLHSSNSVSTMPYAGIAEPTPTSGSNGFGQTSRTNSAGAFEPNSSDPSLAADSSSLAAGLTHSDAEKEDSCPVQ